MMDAGLLFMGEHQASADHGDRLPAACRDIQGGGSDGSRTDA
jgi:hypothetical protein